MKNIERYSPNIQEGLTNQQVEERIQHQLVNYNVEVSTKSVKEIIRSNVVTLFNMINIILAIAVICVGSFKNLTFMIMLLTP